VLFAFLIGSTTLFAADPDQLNTGIQLFEEGRWGDAEGVFKEILESEPTNTTAIQHIGRIYYWRKDHDTALEWLQKAVELEEDNADHHFWLAAAYGRKAQKAGPFTKIGLAKKTKRNFLRAIELNPDHVRARDGLVRFYLQAPGIVGGSDKQAYVELEEIKKRDSVWAHRSYARIHEHEKNYEAAEKEHLAAIEEDPDNTDLYFDLDDFYLKIEDYEGSFRIMEKQLKTQPAELEALYNIGKTGAISGTNLDRAVECLTAYLESDIVESDPPLYKAHYQLGRIYQQRGELEPAASEYEQALALNSNCKEAKKALKKLK
jgi:tetratricopeptide (TPR) repeat protein